VAAQTLGYDRETRIALDGDHYTMVKYGSEDDKNYKVMSKTLADLVGKTGYNMRV
jgi:hypothetical protein